MVVMACVVVMVLVILVIVVVVVIIVTMIVVIIMVVMIPVVMAFMVAMVMAFVIVMILVAMIVMVLMVFLVAMLVVLVVVAMTMDLAVEMFGLTPNQSWTDGRLDRETSTIAEAPLERPADQTIQSVMPGIVLEVVIESGMPFHRHDRREIKLAFLQCL